MKSLFKAALSCAFTALLFAGCMNNASSEISYSQTETVSETSVETALTENTTAVSQWPANGELIENLLDEVCSLAESGRYYAKSTGCSIDQNKNNYFSVIINHVFGNRCYVIYYYDDSKSNIDVENLELSNIKIEDLKIKEKFLFIDGIKYELNDELKQAKIIQKPESEYSWSGELLSRWAQAYPGIGYVYSGTSTVEKNGVSLICESYNNDGYENEKSQFFFDGKKCIEELYTSGDYYSKSTTEYSSEPDESLLTIPEDYEIIK